MESLRNFDEPERVRRTNFAGTASWLYMFAARTKHTLPPPGLVQFNTPKTSTRAAWKVKNDRGISAPHEGRRINQHSPVIHLQKSGIYALSQRCLARRLLIYRGHVTQHGGLSSAISSKDREVHSGKATYPCFDSFRSVICHCRPAEIS